MALEIMAGTVALCKEKHVVDNLHKLFHTHRSSEVTGIVPGRGYESLLLSGLAYRVLDMDQAAIHKLRLDRICKGVSITPLLEDAFEDVREKMGDPFNASEAEYPVISVITFDIGSGAKVQCGCIKMWTSRPGKVSVSFASIVGGFRLAPDLLVVTHTKSNFWKSSQTLEFQTRRRGVTANDVAEFMSMLPAFARIWCEDLPPELLLRDKDNEKETSLAQIKDVARSK